MIQLIGIKSDCGIDMRQNFSISASKLAEKLKSLQSYFCSSVIISTCNRTEIYIDSEKENDELITNVFKALNWDEKLISNIFYVKDNVAVKHLMEVVCGFHSKILGEDQILGQVKTGFEAAQDNKTVSGKLQRLFQDAIACGKKFKEYCEIYKIPVSVSSIVANEAIKREIKKYMIIGFGEIGQLVLKYLSGTKVDVIYIVVRDINKVDDQFRSNELLKFVNFKHAKKLYGEVECIISCTSAPHEIIHKEDLPLRDLLIFDLAVPRDIDSAVRDVVGIELFDIDSISNIDKNNKVKRKEKMSEYRYLIDEAISKFMHWKSLSELSSHIERYKTFGEEITRKRISSFIHKRYTKENEMLVRTLLQSASNVYINRAIEVLKEEKLKGNEDECLRILNKIFQ